MRKFLLYFLTCIVVSSIAFAQMKLNLPSEIDGDEKVSNIKLVLNKAETKSSSYSPTEAPADATSLIPGTIMLGLLGDVTFPFGEEFKNYAGTGWSVHAFGGYSILNSLILGLKAGYIRFGDVETDFSLLEKASQINEGFTQYNTQLIFVLMIQYLIQTACLGPGALGALSALQPYVGIGFCLVFKSYFLAYITNVAANKLAKTVQNGNEFESSSTIFGVTPSVGTYFNVSENIRLILSADYYYLFDKADEEISGSANINYLSLTFGGAYSFR